MNANNEGSVSRGLERLKAFRETVASFAAREMDLQADVAKRRGAELRRHQIAVKENSENLTRAVASADADWKRRFQQTEVFLEARRLRLEKAERSARRDMPKRIETARGRWLGGLQKQKLKLEKDSAAALDAAEAEADAKQKALQVLELRLKATQGKARKVLWPWQRVAAAPGGEVSAALEGDFQSAENAIAQLRAMPALRVARWLPLWLVGPLALAAAGGLFAAGIPGAAWGCLALAGLSLLLFLASAPAQSGPAVALRRDLGAVMTGLAELERQRAGALESTRNEIGERQESESAAIREKWGQVGDVEADFVAAAQLKLGNQALRIAEAIEARAERSRRFFEDGHGAAVVSLEQSSGAQLKQLTAAHEAAVAALDADEAEAWEALRMEWREQSATLWGDLASHGLAASRLSRPWSEHFAGNWQPASEFQPLAAFARLKVDIAALAGALPDPARLPLPGPVEFEMPLALTFPAEGALLLETREPAGTAAAGVLNHIILRLLTTTPPGRLTFTIIDPAGLGAGFAGLMHLADYEEAIINRRIWTQREHIEERLAEHSAHIEKVIQMYLRNDYATIADYNEQAGSVAEKYHFIVVADFPAGFSDVAVKRLQSIAATGPRCGVFTLIHWDQRLPQPDGFVSEELRRNSIRLLREGDQFIIAGGSEKGVHLVLDPPPSAGLAMDLVHRIGQSSVDSTRVQVPFAQIAPKPGDLWTGDTTSELRIAIGRAGATKHQYLAIGKGTRQHALFAGKTGSGKSTLFHVIITNLALTCSPDQVEFYLIDFKKGVEFKCYATHRLPHAKVVAIESDREFALSVLHRVDEELKRRGDLFRKLGVQDVARFKKAGGEGSMPRTLLIIDEFQEFFVEDDSIAQTASLLFDRIVRQGRAFGIHVLLGSQTLGGAYSLARATLGQMAIRVALQCNEADAYLIMDDGNASPRLLSRPGEGIYNDAAGAIEGNSPFQVVWLPDEEREDWLRKVQEMEAANGNRHPGPVVFEGNAPADPAENPALVAAMRSVAAQRPGFGRAWLGAPNAIKGPTEAAFCRQSGSHLLIVGQREEAALTMMTLAARALAGQYPEGAALFYFLHSAAPGTAEAERIAQLRLSMPHGFREVTLQDVPAAVGQLADELKGRSSGDIRLDQAPEIYVFIHCLHRLKKLRQEDDFRFGDSAGADPGSQFQDLITEGGSHGIHLIATVDTFNNVNRSMSRKALSEFEMRVVFQMSANDSSSLIDSPAASTLGLHRAIFYSEQAGVTETFRPYAVPPQDWWHSGGGSSSRETGEVPQPAVQMLHTAEAATD
jgi:hypothetical protein